MTVSLNNLSTTYRRATTPIGNNLPRSPVRRPKVSLKSNHLRSLSETAKLKNKVKTIREQTGKVEKMKMSCTKDK